MCCFASALLLFGPRLGFLIYWLLPIGRSQVARAFGSSGWIVALLGLIFLPWTILLYVILYPIVGWEWIVVVLAFVADIAAYTGGFRSRKQAPGYSRR